MHALFSLAALLVILTPIDQKLPQEFYRLPAEMRKKATVIISGTYVKKAGLKVQSGEVFYRPLLTGFNIKQTYRGKVGSGYIGISSLESEQTKQVKQGLKVGHNYLVLLRPSPESAKVIKTGEGSEYYGNALGGEEIIAIVELR
jgi:hypothetical protein